MSFDTGIIFYNLHLFIFKIKDKYSSMKTIGITGGKGGTGKSTIATALACKLAKSSRVLLADMDADCPNDHLLLNIKREKRETVFQRIPKFDFKKCTKCGMCSVVCKSNAIVCINNNYPVFIKQQCNGCGACHVKCPTGAITWSKKEIGCIWQSKGCNMDLISCELKINEPVSELVVDTAKKIIEKEKNKYDYVLVDTAAGTHCDVICALSGCDFVLAVTEATPLGMHDLNLIEELLDKMKLPYELVLNRYEPKNKLPEKKFIAKIRYKKEIMESYSKGVPVEDETINKIADFIIAKK